MTEQVKFFDASAGWIASDDQINGRKNGLLRMDGITLDENGALIMSNGTRRHVTTYPAVAHTLFSKFVCGTKRRYLGLTSGAVYRDTTAIIAVAGASATRGAFGVFSDFVLKMLVMERQLILFWMLRQLNLLLLAMLQHSSVQQPLAR